MPPPRRPLLSRNHLAPNQPHRLCPHTQHPNVRETTQHQTSPTDHAPTPTPPHFRETTQHQTSPTHYAPSPTAPHFRETTQHQTSPTNYAPSPTTTNFRENTPHQTSPTHYAPSPPPPTFAKPPTTTPAPPILPPPPPPPTFEKPISTKPAPPIMPPPPPPPTFVKPLSTKPAPPIMPPPPPPPTFEGQTTRKPSPPLPPPPPPPQSFEVLASTKPSPPMPPPPPPPYVFDEEANKPGPPMPPPPPPPMCQEGFVFNETTGECDPVNVCATCVINEECVNVNGTFACKCVSGFAKNISGVCADVNECAAQISPCKHNENCSNTVGNFTCKCKTGFERLEAGCIDINECGLNKTRCGLNERCNNLNGSSECICMDGFVKNLTPNICQDVNECTDGSNTCVANEDCVNTDGGFVCLCKTGYTGTGGNCSNLNECKSNPCHAQAICTDTIGSHTCACKPGYTGDGFQCTDIDECQTGGDNCNAIEKCSNTEGSFVCTCIPGYNRTGANCENINECLASPCHRSANCTDTVGSYQCACDQGYSGDGFNCTDINECERNPCNLVTEECMNTIGSYTCKCANGYNSVSGVCTDIDECTNGLNTCHSNATCVNTPGSFSCSCNCGYSDFAAIPGTDCVFDACKYTHHPCDQNCITSRDGFSCGCDAGFTLQADNTTCLSTQPCSSTSCISGTCYVDAAGNTQCRCNKGFEPFLGFTTFCTTINECAGTHHCEQNCLNPAGATTHTCSCNSGYAPAAHAPDFCCDKAVSVCNTGVSKCGNGTCLDDFTTSKLYRCECNTGWRGTECTEDVNECLAHGQSVVIPGCFPSILSPSACVTTNLMCLNGGSCRNTQGSFECDCKPGYTGQKCDIDINECTNGQASCSINATCTNTNGSFICTCNTGFVVPSGGPFDGSVCIEQLVQPFGIAVGDSALEQSSYSNIVTSEVGFVIGNKTYYRIYGTSNGVLVLQTSSGSRTQSAYANSFSADLSTSSTTGDGLIAGFWTRLQPKDNPVYYQHIVMGKTNAAGEQLLSMVNNAIRSQVNVIEQPILNFQAKEVFKLTYSVVPYHPSFLSTTGVGLTFQILYATDGIRSFALTSYSDMLACNLMGYRGKVGYTNPQKSFTHSVTTSSNPNRPDLFVGPNTGKKGVFIMRTDDATTDMTQTPEAACQAWYDNEPNATTWLEKTACPPTIFNADYDKSFITTPIWPPHAGVGPAPLKGVVTSDVLMSLRQWTGSLCFQSNVRRNQHFWPYMLLQGECWCIYIQWLSKWRLLWAVCYLFQHG
ncbi:uncharacterized protein LOC100184790 [Ciona intestinalis]